MNKKALLPLIGLFLLVTGIVLPGSAHAQISEGGTPTSFKYQNTLKSDLPTVQIPINFSVEDLKTVDRWQVSQGAPLKVGVLLPTDLTIDNAGSWNTLPDGKRVWRLQVQAKDAIALMLSFRDFYIPENGKLFIYSSDKTHLIGAFTHHTNPPTKEYATEFLAGDKIILEYEAGISENEHPRIAIDAVGYGYNHLHVSRTMADTGPGTSGSCMVNINCEEGEAWQTEKNGICQMTLPIGNYIYICSGALVNNTAEDLKPYILSAFHCIDLDIPVTEKNLNKYTFYFHFEHTGCENNSSIASYRTITGCKKIAGIPLDGGSDGLLLLLNQTIPEHYNAYYNGWDRSNTAAPIRSRYPSSVRGLYEDIDFQQGGKDLYLVWYRQHQRRTKRTLERRVRTNSQWACCNGRRILWFSIVQSKQTDCRYIEWRFIFLRKTERSQYLW